MLKETPLSVPSRIAAGKGFVSCNNMVPGGLFPVSRTQRKMALCVQCSICFLWVSCCGVLSKSLTREIDAATTLEYGAVIPLTAQAWTLLRMHMS